MESITCPPAPPHPSTLAPPCQVPQIQQIAASTEYTDHSRTALRQGLGRVVPKCETCLTKWSQCESPQCLTHWRPSLPWKTPSLVKYPASTHVMPDKCLVKASIETHWAWSHLCFLAGDCWGVSSQDRGLVHAEHTLVSPAWINHTFKVPDLVSQGSRPPVDFG